MYDCTMYSSPDPLTVEPTGLSRSDGKRPDGVTIASCMEDRPHACMGCFLHRHICHISPSTDCHRGKSCAGLTEQRKRNKYESLARTNNFIPVVVETSGAFGTEALDLFAEIGRRIHAITHEAKSRAILIQQMFVALQCGNAALVLGTMGPIPSGYT